MEKSVFQKYYDVIDGGGIFYERKLFEDNKLLIEVSDGNKKIEEYCVQDFYGFIHIDDWFPDGPPWINRAEFFIARPKYLALNLCYDTGDLIKFTAKENLIELYYSYKLEWNLVRKELKHLTSEEEFKKYYEDFIDYMKRIERLFKTSFLENSIDHDVRLLDDDISKNEKIKLSIPKIKWLGNIVTLAALFDDLLKEHEDKGPYIQADRADLIDFIISNFTDANGNALEYETIRKYLTGSRQKLMNVKDRIDLNKYNNDKKESN